MKFFLVVALIITANVVLWHLGYGDLYCTGRIDSITPGC